ncbi:MAG: ATP-binding protein [Ignavibacteriae bacterium]|nr:ATP-binding protein [Ignavibacteriota bacterium]
MAKKSGKKTKTAAKKVEPKKIEPKKFEPKKFEIELVSTPKEIAHVEQFLDQVNAAAKLDDGTFYRLLVASTEAVNNAIMHGNKSDPRKKVFLTILFKKHESLTVTIQDQGTGFNPENVPSPIDDSNLFKTSGRGVFLMKELMDEVNYSFGKEGSKVELVINLKRLR